MDPHSLGAILPPWPLLLCTGVSWKSDQSVRPLDLPPGRAHAIHPALLRPAQPRLLRVPLGALADKVHNQPANDAHKRNGIHPMDTQPEDFDPNDHAPEIAREEGDIEEGRAREAEHERRPAVEDGEAEGVADHVAGDLAVGAPVGDGVEAVAVEDARLRARDEHAPEAELADDFVQRAFRDEEFLGHVAEAVEGRARQGEEVAFQLVAAGDAPRGGPLRDVVAAEEDADAADADEDAEDLRPVVADPEEDAGDEHYHDDGPEVDQLRAEDGGVAVREHGEVVALYVEEGEDEIFPAALHDDRVHVAPEAVLVDGVSGVEQIEQYVVPEGLEGGDGEGVRHK